MKIPFKQYCSCFIFLIALQTTEMLQAQTKPVKKDSIVHLSEDLQAIAYGKVKRRQVTSSINTLTGDDIEKNTVFSLGNVWR